MTYLKFSSFDIPGRVKFVEETVSDKMARHGRKIAAALGDFLNVNELSRIGRSMFNCMEVCANAAKGKSGSA